MKHVYPLVLLFQFVSIALFGNSELVPFYEKAPLIDHLNSINKEWNKQKDLPTDLLTIPMKFNTDDERIQLHLKLVESILNKRSSDHLTIRQFANRKQNLKSLVEYWNEGQFPINTRHSHRQPYFIDDYGTACAVGHLLLTSGEERLAHHISDVQNYAYIHEMNYAELDKWAMENGFTKDELAWIQPVYGDYCYYTQDINDIPEYSEDNQPLSQQEIRAMMPLPDGSMMIIGGSFLHYEAASGTQTASVFGYDGSNYISFGNAIQGTVYDIEYHNNQIYVAGDFVLAGTDFYNIAYWDGYAWVGIQTGDMDGIVKDIVSYECKLYAGGDFITVDGNSIAYFAGWDGTTWTATPQNCAGENAPSILQVNAPVNALEVYDNKLAIGGEFTQIAGFAAPVEGLIFLDNLTIEFLPEHGSMTSVDNLETYDSRLMVGGDSLYAYRWNKWYYPLDTIRIEELPFWPSENLPQIPPVGRTHTIYHPDYPDDSYGYSTFQESTHLIISTGQETFAINGGPSSIYYPANTNYHFFTDGAVYAISHFEYHAFFGGNFTSINIDSNPVIHDECDMDYNALNMFMLNRFTLLPVELTEFTVTSPDSKTAHLKWVTETESNSSHYEIERKVGNENFVRVGTVAAAGESLEQINYTFANDISLIEEEYVYYRLKIVDNDGSYEYSDTRSLRISRSDAGISIRPNPAASTTELSLYMKSGGDVNVYIYDMQGRQVSDYQWTHDSNSVVRERIDVSHLEAGLYLVEVVSPHERKTIKLDVLR